MLHVRSKLDCSLDYDLTDYLDIEKKFCRFLELLAVMVCPQSCHIQFVNDICKYRTKWKGHNKGALVRILADGPPVPSQTIKVWGQDTEHGLFHGVMTAFFAMLYKYPNGIPDTEFDEQTSVKINTPITENERLICTCLVHDFAKSCFAVEPHDQILRNWFFSLTDTGYSHSNPSEINELVVADRWELMRFSDYKNWIKPELLNFYNSNKQKIQLGCFHAHIRPALEKLIVGRDDVWFRHTPERMWVNDQFSKLTKDSIYPPPGFWKAKQDSNDYYAVETGTLPPRACLLHGYTKNNSPSDTDPASYSPYGMISLSTLKQHDSAGKLVQPCVRVDKDESLGSGKNQNLWPTKRWLGENWSEIIDKSGFANNVFISREHLSTCAKVPLKNWIFLYDDGGLDGRKKLERDWPNILTNSGGLARVHLATNFMELLKQIESVLIAVRA